MIRAVGPAAIVAAALAVPLCYVPRFESSFSEPKLALLLVAGALAWAGWLLAWRRGAPTAGRASLRAALAAVVITTVLAAVIAGFRRPTGAPYALAEIVRLLAMIGVAAAAAQATRDPLWRRRLFDAIHVAAGVVSLIGLLQHLTLLPFAIPVISVPGSTFGNRNMAAEAVAMAIPFGFAALASYRFRWRRVPDGVREAAGGFRPWLAAGLLLAEVLFLAATRARGAWIGGAFGVMAFFAVRRPALPRRALLLLLPVAAGVMAAALLPGRWRARDANDAKRYESGGRVVLDALDPTSSVVRTRMGLWRRTLAVYREHPLTGVGPGNFPVLFPLHAEPRAAADGVMSANMVPRRPHNELLERLAETGPLGLAAFGALFVTALASALAAARAARARAGGGEAGTDVDAASAAAGGIAACLGCGLTAFPLAMPATAFLFGVSLGIVDALAPATAPATAPAVPARGGTPAARFQAANAVAAVLAVALVAGAGVLSFGIVASSYWRGRAKAALATGADRRPDAAAALRFLGRAAGAPRIDSARFDIALRAAQVALRIDRGAPALAAADRALALEPFSPHAWAMRAGAELALGDRAHADEDAQHAMRLFLDLPSARTTLETIRRLEAIEPDVGRDVLILRGRSE